MRGAVIGGRYLVENPVASGGGGAVWRGRDTTTGAPVAIKLIVADSPSTIDRFAREARIVASLDHPGIVRYVAHGSTPSGSLFLVTEWIAGESLSAALDRGPLPIADAVALARAVAVALAAIHAIGVVHRDVKPGNLVLEGGEVARPRLLDFGIARACAAARVTATGGPIGTPGYMAPEQVRGEAEIDARADVFSLGCVLFRALAGEAPFRGEDVIATLLRTALDEPPALDDLRPEVPPALSALVARMLSKDRALRPESGAAVIEELDALESSTAPPEGSPPAGPRAITSEEQRVTSIVLAAPEPAAAGQPSEDTSPTSRDPDLGGLIEAARDALRPLGARVERLGDSALIAIPPELGGGTEEATLAARCALVLRATLPARVRIALATGRGAGGAVPWGAAIDRAVSALQSAGAEVAIDPSSAGLLRSRFVVAESEGRLLLRAERCAGSLSPAARGARPFVGRERDLAAVLTLARGAFDEKEAAALVLTAPAGMGKSRLGSEAVACLREERAITVWLGRGDPAFARAPFSVLAGLVRHAAGVSPEDPAAAQGDRLAALVRRHVAEPAAATSVAAQLERVLSPSRRTPAAEEGASGQAVAAGDRIREAWFTLLGAACSAGPVLLVLDDLHLTDRTTLDYVGGALHVLRAAPLFVLGLGRPEGDLAQEALWPYSSVSRIALRGLSPAASEALCRMVLGRGASEGAVREVLAGAANNPFYIEELARHVREGAAGGVPDSVLALLVSRLRQLDPVERRALRAASVLGERFQAAGVAELIGTSAELARVTLERLVEREVLVPEQPGGAGGGGAFAFRHALLREAADAMLTDADRALGHRLAATWLCGQEGVQPRIVAEHFERGGDRAQAAGWHLRSARSALEGNDFEAAIVLAERAVAGGVRGEDLGTARLCQAEAHRWRAENVAMEARAVEAMSLFSPGGPPWCEALVVASLARGRLGHDERSVALGRVLLDAAGPGTPHRAWLRAAGRVAANLGIAGATEMADALLARVEAAGDIDADPVVAGAVNEARGDRALKEGRPGKAVLYFEAAARALLAANDLRLSIRAATAAGLAYRVAGEYELSAAWLREARRICERLGFASMVSSVDHALVPVYAGMGRRMEARLSAARAIAAFSACGNRRMAQATRVYLALLLAEEGDLEVAVREAKAAAEPIQGVPGLRAHALGVLARIHLAAGRTDEALAASEEAFSLFKAARGLEEGTAIIYLARAECLAAAGAVVAARETLFEAERWLLERARDLEEPSRRERFLRRDPHHAAILDLVEAARAIAAGAPDDGSD